MDVLTVTEAAPSREILLARVPGFVAEIAEGASRREQAHELPFAAFHRIRELGLGTLRVPTELGGPGGSAADYIGMIADIGAGDPNVAHALRSHFNYVEHAILTPAAERDPDSISRILAGRLFAGAHTEQNTARPGEVTTRLHQTTGGYRLRGRKWYATGSAFADYLSFSAVDDDGQPARVLLPIDRAGITVLDDWDGMGQQLTASGGIILDDVAVFADEVAYRQLDTLVGRHCSTLRQLHLAATASGALRGALADGLAYVRNQARSAAHSMAETAEADPFVQQAIGDISTASYATDAAIAMAARHLDLTAIAIAGGDEDSIEAALIASALATSRSQLLLGALGPRAAERLFDLGGGSTTSRALNLDRHWRNIRTLLCHNPLLHKARVVGDYLINGTTTHLREGRVF